MKTLEETKEQDFGCSKGNTIMDISVRGNKTMGNDTEAEKKK